MEKRDIVKYYIALFDRIPEKEAVDNWYSEAIENKWGEAELTSALLNAAVSVVNSVDSLQEVYPQYVNFNEKDFNSVRNVIESVYKSLFDKSYEDDKEGIDNWTKKVVDGKISLSQAIVEIEHFTEAVYNGKVDLKSVGYSDEEIVSIQKAVDTFESRVEFADKISDIIKTVKVDNNSLSSLEEAIFLVHSKEDYAKACEFLEDNIFKIVPSNEAEVIKNELASIYVCEDNHNDSLLDTTENLGYIDLPSHIEPSIEDNVDMCIF